HDRDDADASGACAAGAAASSRDGGGMTDKMPITMTVNGEAMSGHVAPRDTLADFLRQDLQLTGTHLGCEMGACGACLVLLDDKPIHSCLMFAVQADGTQIETIEGLNDRGIIADIQ